MLSFIRSATRNSIIYGFGNISSKLVGFILLPIYTKYFTVADYGILGLAEVTAQVLISILGLNLYVGLFRWYWDKEYISRQKSIFFSTLIVLIFLLLISSFFLFLFAPKISSLLFTESQYPDLFRLLILTTSLEIIGSMPATLMRLKEKSVLFTISTSARFFVNLIFTFVFVVYLKHGIIGIYESQLVGLIVFFIIVSPFIIVNSRPKFEKDAIWKMVKYCFPLVLSSISAILLLVIGRYVLNYMSGLKDVGLYTLGYKIGNTIYMLVVATAQLALTPMMFKLIDDPENKRIYSKILTYFTYCLMFCVLGLSFFSKEIVKVLATNPDYWEAASIVPVICFSVLFMSMKDIVVIGFHVKKKMAAFAILTTLSLAINFILNLILIPHLNSMGTAYASLLSQLAFFLLIYFFAQKYYPVPYEKGKILIMITVGMLLYFITLGINEWAVLWRIIIKSLLIISFPLILGLFRFYDKIEIERLSQGWTKWKNPSNWKENLKTFNNSLGI